MKPAWLLIAALSLAAAAPCAMAQASAPNLSCDLLRKLAQNAPADFAAYRGAAIPRAKGVYQTRFSLPGHLCVISIQSGDSSALCHTGALSAASAVKLYDSELARIRVCFPGRKEAPPIYSEKGNPVQVDRGVRLVQQTNGNELAIGLILGRDDRVSPAQYRLGLGVIWKKLTTGS